MRFPDYTYQMGHIINKYSLASHERQFALVMDYNGAITGTARSLFVYHGYDDGGDYAYEQVLETDTQLSPDTWYFIHLTYLASTNTYTIRAWDD
jgi:hypothetical protein